MPRLSGCPPPPRHRTAVPLPSGCHAFRQNSSPAAAGGAATLPLDPGSPPDGMGAIPHAAGSSLDGAGATPRPAGSPLHERGAAPRRRSADPARRREHPARRREHPARRREHPARRREHPARRREHPERRREHPARRREHPGRRREHPARNGGGVFARKSALSGPWGGHSCPSPPAVAASHASPHPGRFPRVGKPVPRREIRPFRAPDGSFHGCLRGIPPGFNLPAKLLKTAHVKKISAASR